MTSNRIHEQSRPPTTARPVPSSPTKAHSATIPLVALLIGIPNLPIRAATTDPPPLKSNTTPSPAWTKLPK